MSQIFDLGLCFNCMAKNCAGAVSRLWVMLSDRDRYKSYIYMR